MKNIYEAIAAQLKANVPELKWIDLEKGQMNFARPPILFPAALIQIQLPKTENLNAKKQMCNALITVRLCFDYNGNTDITSTPDEARAESLAYFDIKQKVYINLQAFSTSEMNGLERVNEFDDLRPDNYKVSGISFATHYRDDTADV